MYTKEERYEFKYAVPTAEGNESIKTIYPRSKSRIEENKAACKKHGYRFISVKKLYPFNTYKNQHNFELIYNICFCNLNDMEIGEKPMDRAEYDRLYELKEKAEQFFCLPLPVAWLPWEDWKDAKELAEMAILHRQNACIEAGRYDLVALCAE